MVITHTNKEGIATLWNSLKAQGWTQTGVTEEAYGTVRFLVSPDGRKSASFTYTDKYIVDRYENGAQVEKIYQA